MMKSIVFELSVAFRYISSKQKEGFLRALNIFSFVGIMLGVMTLIIVMSVMKGYELELIERILSFRSHITLLTNTTSEETSRVMNMVQKIPHIVHVSPVIEGQAMITDGEKMRGVYVRGIDLCNLRKSMLDAITDLFGNAVSQQELCLMRSSTLVGVTLFRDFLYPDKLKFATPSSSATIVGDIPRMKTFDVNGVFDLEMHEYNSNIAFLSLQDAKILFNQKKIGNIEIVIDNVENMEIVLNDIKKLDLPYAMIDWRKANSGLSSALAIERNIMFIILSLIIIIATFNIVSSLVILVYVKKTDIAIMRTMGATRAMIGRIFIFAGCAIGFSATLFGAFFAILFCKNINHIRKLFEKFFDVSLMDPTVYHILSLPTEISYSSCALIICMAFAFSILATIYPSIKIANMTPSRVLREML